MSGDEISHIIESVHSGKISGDGIFTKKCQEFFEHRYGFKKALLTTSCTDALELAALLINIQPGDEVIVPSYTFVSTANAFVLRGANVVFVDSENDHPNMDAHTIEPLITNRTKAIVPVHYAGNSCDMEAIVKLAQKHNLFIIEDAAQAIESFYNRDGKRQPLGTIGDLATFSFHETKNIISGEGGLLAINNERFVERAEILREKGTNRAKFFRGQIDKYSWVDVGSSFLPSDIIAAFLYAQLEQIDRIQQKRLEVWSEYYQSLVHLEETGLVKLPKLPEYATNNAHIFYLVFKSPELRTDAIEYLKSKNINSVFHYLSLHKSQFYADKHGTRELPNCDRYSDCLLRLPVFYDLDKASQNRVIQAVNEWAAQQAAMR